MSGFVNVAKSSDFREGKIRRYFVDGNEVGIVYWRDAFYAFSNRCTHRDFQLHFGYVEDDKLHCPIHYAVFDLESGKALEGPYAIPDLPVYSVRVQGEDVLLDVAEKRET